MRSRRPLVRASTTAASVTPGARSPIDHIAEGNSWACTAVNHRTTSTGSRNRGSDSPWWCRRAQVSWAGARGGVRDGSVDAGRVEAVTDIRFVPGLRSGGASHVVSLVSEALPRPPRTITTLLAQSEI